MRKYVLIVTFIQESLYPYAFGVGTIHDTEMECYRKELPRLPAKGNYVARCLTVKEVMETYEYLSWR